MIQYFITFFKFILPILKQSIATVAVEELTKVAYPEAKRRNAAPKGYLRYNRMSDAPRSSREAFHDVLMVAFDITGPNAALVHEWLSNQMPIPGVEYQHGERIGLESWWIADDGAPGDLDSAVFVPKGDQDAARRILREAGLVE